MKKLLNDKQYKQVLDLFDKQSNSCTDVIINMAIKACSYLNEHQRIIEIEQKLSTASLNNSYIQTTLIQFYIQHHDIKNACRLFSKINDKSNYMCSTMFKGLILDEMPEKVFDLLDQTNIQLNEVTLAVIFSACAQVADDRAKQIGKEFLNKMPDHFQTNNVLLTSAINMLMKFGDVTYAEKLFEMIKKKDTIAYGAMMNGYVQNNMSDKALDLFEQIPFPLHDVNYVIVMKACAQLCNDRAKLIGRKLFDQLPKSYERSNHMLNSALNMLMKFGDVTSAEKLFEMIKKKDIVTYRAMINGYVENNMSDKALDLFEQMPGNLDDIIYFIVIKACAQLCNDRAKLIGRKLLDQLPKNYERSNPMLNSALNMLMKFGDVTSAEKLFEMIKKKDIITYGAMMNGYVENNMSDKALDLFEQIPFPLHDTSYVIVFKACAQLCNDRAKLIGRKLLDQLPKNYERSNPMLNSALNMLMKFGDVISAEKLFEIIQGKNIITFGAMMNGYNINNEPLKCFQLLEQIQEHGFSLNEIISTILINACAQLSMMSICESVITRIPSQFFNNQHIRNSLIHMWGKAGSVKKAEKIFEAVDKPDVITYNAMINAYGLNRMGLEAVDLYRKMPHHLHDEVTYICVLNACSHSGLLGEAHFIFNDIPQKNKQIITTMIDCLSRLYIFDEAQKLIDDYEKTNPPYSVMYMAILSGARNSRQQILSKQIYDRMKILFPNQRETLISASILLCNIYSSLGDYEEAENIRSNRIKKIGRKVKPGVTWTELNGEIVEFTANDRSHPQSKEIHAQAKHISNVLVKYGHNYDSSWITRPLREDETVESVLCSHSERLAIAFHFIQPEKPSFIQITKNLRVCGDCHRATKLIAKIWQCTIIVRDANGIHHFSPDGTCSCQDHF